MPRTTRRTPTHGAITLCCAPFQATCRRRVETPAAAPPSQTQQRIAQRKAVSVARKPPRGRPASCLFIRHYWGHRSYFLLLRRVICLSSAGSSACLRSIACKPPPERATRRTPGSGRRPRRGGTGTGSEGWTVGECGAPRMKHASALDGGAGRARPVGAGVGPGTPKRIQTFLNTQPGSDPTPHTPPTPYRGPQRPPQGSVRTPVPAPHARGGHQKESVTATAPR